MFIIWVSTTTGVFKNHIFSIVNSHVWTTSSSHSFTLLRKSRLRFTQQSNQHTNMSDCLPLLCTKKIQFVCKVCLSNFKWIILHELLFCFQSSAIYFLFSVENEKQMVDSPCRESISLRQGMFGSTDFCIDSYEFIEMQIYGLYLCSELHLHKFQTLGISSLSAITWRNIVIVLSPRYPISWIWCANAHSSNTEIHASTV